MCLPIVIIFENHWDTIPKCVTRDLLPDLNKRGYQTLCFEAPHNLSIEQILLRHNWGLQEGLQIKKSAEELLKQQGIVCKLSEQRFDRLAGLMRWYVSSKKYEYVAEKIKELPASLILKEVFEKTQELSMSLKGIDIKSEDFDNMLSKDISQRIEPITSREENRISTMFYNLLELKDKQEEGIIFVCGASHAEGLVEAFKTKELENEILYYYPYSSNCYREAEGVLQLSKNTTLEGHSYLLDKNNMESFRTRVIQEIIKKTTYTKEIFYEDIYPHFLSNYFEANFRVFFRPGFHADALIDAEDPSIEHIRQCIGAKGMHMHPASLEGRNYLVIPNINAPDIAKKLEELSS